jgi:hypothetical protein
MLRFDCLWLLSILDAYEFLFIFEAAARALIDEPHLSAEEIARKSMKIAADICVYTNHNVIVEVLDENESAMLSKEEKEKSK